MTHIAADDRLKAMRRAEGSLESHATGKAVMRSMSADYLQAPAPKRRTWRIEGPAFAAVLLGTSAGVFVGGLIAVAQAILNNLGG